MIGYQLQPGLKLLQLAAGALQLTANCLLMCYWSPDAWWQLLTAALQPVLMLQSLV